MAVLSKDPEVLGVNQANLELWDLERVREILIRYKPVVVIHVAEFSDMEQCEAQPWEALRMNAMGTQNLMLCAMEVNASMVYVSTDQVFNGLKKGPYVEWDTPEPVNLYGHSKLAGEMLVRDHLQKFYIIRSSGLYGKHGTNFACQVLKAARSEQTLQVPDDEATLPTYTRDLAQAIYRLMGTGFYGTYHITNTAQRTGLSWYDWGKMVLDTAGLSTELIQPVPSGSLSRAAKRPPRPILGNAFYRLRQLSPMRSCQDALKAFLTELDAVRK